MAPVLKDLAGALRVSILMAQIFGDLSESQRLHLSPVTCSLTGVHQMLQAACTVPCMPSNGDVISNLEERVGTVSMVLGLNVI